MNPLAMFIAFMARRRAIRVHAAQVRRAAVIEQQIAERKRRHQAWRYLLGELRLAKLEMLKAECAMRRAA
jgi:hypothetical protein